MKLYRYTGETDELTTFGKIYEVQDDNTFIDDTMTTCGLSKGFEKYFQLVEEEPTLRDKIQIEKQKEDFAMGFGNWLWKHRFSMELQTDSPVGMIRKPMIELLEIYIKEKEV